MVLWEIFAIAGLAFLILEMIVPSMFFLNLALAGFVTAIVALFVKGWIILTFICGAFNSFYSFVKTNFD